MIRICRTEKENGAALIGALVVILLSTIVMAALLGRVSYQTKTAHNMKQRDLHFYEVEESLGQALNWLRDNGTRLTPLFVEPAFSTLFDRSSFSIGANDHREIAPAFTKVKLKGTSDSFIISVNSSSVNPAEPSGTGTFSFISSLGQTYTGRGDVIITLVDAVPVP